MPGTILGAWDTPVDHTKTPSLVRLHGSVLGSAAGAGGAQRREDRLRVLGQIAGAGTGFLGEDTFAEWDWRMRARLGSGVPVRMSESWAGSGWQGPRG